MSRYYSVIGKLFEDNLNGDFRLPIKWNIKEISNQINACGFIVQHMNVDSSNKCIPSNDYFEAWLVKDGVVSGDDKNQYWDDVWTAPYSYVETDIGEMCVLFSSKVYWVPIDSDEFNHVMKWRRDAVVESGGLRSAKSIDWNIENYFVCERHYESKRRFNV